MQSKIEKAKETLKKAGYFIDNLWSLEDLENYKGSDEQKQKVLFKALTNEATMEQIWFAIRNAAEVEGLTKIEELYE
jgi:hypothetical protein